MAKAMTTSSLRDVSELLAPEAVDTLTPEELPALIATLAAAQAHAAARLAATATVRRPPSPEAPADRLLDAREAATRLGMSEDWLYRHKDELPFTRRLGRRTIRFSEAGIARWLSCRR